MHKLVCFFDSLATFLRAIMSLNNKLKHDDDDDDDDFDNIDDKC